MGQLLGSISEYLEKENWTYSRPADDLIKTGVSTKNAQWGIHIMADEEDNVVFCYSICPVDAPAHLRVKVSEYLMRTNRGCSVGNFVMDFDDGEIRFRTIAYAEGGKMTAPAMELLLDANISFMDRYLPGIMLVIYSDVTPAEALSEVLTGKPVDKRYIYN